MKEHKNIKDELQGISPFLAKLKKPNDGFEVPQNYFQNLENNIFARIKAEEKVEAWSVSDTKETTIAPTQSWMQSIIQSLMSWFTKPSISISLAMVIIIGIGFALFQTGNQAETIEIAQIEWTTDEAIASLTVDEVNKYVEDNVEDFSEELLLEVAEELIFVDETVEIITPTEVELDVELEDIEQYIEDNISDFDEDILLEEY